MPDLILRNGPLGGRKSVEVQLRYHGPVETEYVHVCYVTPEAAREMVKAGAPFWLFGDPDDAEKKA
jgi:hypothetical protein